MLVKHGCVGQALPQPALNMFMLPLQDLEHLKALTSQKARDWCLGRRFRKSAGEGEVSSRPFSGVFSIKLNSSSNPAIAEQVEVRARQTMAGLNQDWSVTRLWYGYVYGTVQSSLKPPHQRQTIRSDVPVPELLTWARFRACGEKQALPRHCQQPVKLICKPVRSWKCQFIPTDPRGSWG